MVPSVLQPLTPLAVQAGDTAVLTCRICGRPRPDIKWTFQGNSSIQPGQRFQINSNEDGFVSLTVSYTFAIYCVVYNILASTVLVRLTITLLKHRHFVKLRIQCLLFSDKRHFLGGQRWIFVYSLQWTRIYNNNHPCYSSLYVMSFFKIWNLCLVKFTCILPPKNCVFYPQYAKMTVI